MIKSNRSKLAVTAICSLTAAGCGSSSSTSASLGSVGLSTLPSVSGMIKTNGSSASLTGGSSYAVTGTAPLVSALKASADTYFWNGLIATLNATNANAITSAQRNKF